MDVSSASSILFRVREQPSVKSAQARVDATKRELDRIELSRQGDWNTRMTNYEPMINQMWQQQQYGVRELAGTAILLGIAGGAFAVSAVASMIPALVPFKGILMIGALVAGWKYLPEAAGKFVVRPLLKRRVNKQMDRYLDMEHQRTARQLDMYQGQYDLTVKAATEELTRKAAEEMLARQGKPQPSTEVKVEEQQVKLGGIVVPRRADTP